jgi:hypothetical protein
LRLDFFREALLFLGASSSSSLSSRGDLAFFFGASSSSSLSSLA